MRIHHVQLGMPADGEDAGRRFYAQGLGLTEVAKPAELTTRGGAWFRSSGGAEIHLGVERDPRPPERAHPALAVDSERELEELGERLATMAYDVDWTQRYNAETFQRFHVRDPFGNRLEMVWVVPVEPGVTCE